MKSSIPAATVSRLPVYLRSLGEISREQSTCSSEHIASVSGVNSAQVRKDLSYLGSHGVRGVGYNVDELRSQLRKALGLTHNYPVAIVGAGNLGSALVNYPGFVMWGFEVVALLDSDTSKMGSVIGRIPVSPDRGARSAGGKPGRADRDHRHACRRCSGSRQSVFGIWRPIDTQFRPCRAAGPRRGRGTEG